MRTGFSRRSFAVSVVLGVVTLASGAARAQVGFNNIVVFGDSLSDAGNTPTANGNLYTAITNNFGAAFAVPKAPYFRGRFTNGPVWAEDVAQALGVPLRDFAYGGARTDATNSAGLGAVSPGMQTQVSSFVAANTNTSINSQALYVLWGGANDYLNGGQTNPAVPVTNLTNEINSLAQVGVTRFLVVNLPNLGALPSTSGTAASTSLTALTNAHNTGLATALAGISAARPGVTLSLLDVNSLFTSAINNPSAFGFTNVTSSYVTNNGGVTGANAQTIGTGDPNKYLFWDELHPTAATHQLIANRALGVLGAANAPEPASLALFALPGMVFAGRVARRRCRQASRE